MRAYRIGMKINGMAAAALREKHDLVEGMPMRRRQIRVLAQIIAEARKGEFSHTLVGAQQITDTVCWNFFLQGQKYFANLSANMR